MAAERSLDAVPAATPRDNSRKVKVTRLKVKVIEEDQGRDIFICGADKFKKHLVVRDSV